jgi:tetratricopeptide (TPR) repeat protein
MTRWLGHGTSNRRPFAPLLAFFATAPSPDAPGCRFDHAAGPLWRWSRGMVMACLMLSTFAVGSLTGTATADQTDHRLPALFDQLQQAKTPSEAASIEGAIWSIWTESGNQDLDRLMMEGTAAMAIDDYATALSDFDEVTNRAPQFAEGWNKRATLLYLIGDLQASLADIGRVLKLEPRHFGALAGLGLVNLGLDHEEAARDAFRDVLKIDPMNSAARANLKAVQQEIDKKSI